MCPEDEETERAEEENKEDDAETAREEKSTSDEKDEEYRTRDREGLKKGLKDEEKKGKTLGLEGSGSELECFDHETEVEWVATTSTVLEGDTVCSVDVS